jgi:DNA-binding IclR family transcriptional regulator
VAVPILGAQSAAVAAISLARQTTTSTSIDELVHQFVPRLQGVAERISIALGTVRFVTVHGVRPDR